MLEAGISATGQIAQAWGLMTATPARKSAPTPGERIRPQPLHARKPTPKPAHKATGVSAIIEDALRKAGLMR